MRKFLLAIGISLLLVQGAFAETILKPGHPDQYVVKKGDTLWGIASMFLSDAWMWPEIWHINPDIKNPDLIYPGDTVVLHYVNGKPQLSVRRGEAGRTVKLTPESNSDVSLKPRVRATPLASSIPAIPLDAIAQFLRKGRIVQRDTLEKAPHIVAGTSEQLILGPGDEFYARGNWVDNTSVYGIYREGNAYIDPETHEFLGYEATEVGTASVKSRDGNLVKLDLDTVDEDVRIGDRLLPTAQQKVESMFYPSAPSQDINGVVMRILGDDSMGGRNDVVALNRGEEQGLAAGNVLAISKPGKTVRDSVEHDSVHLPPERVGLLMVFRTFEKMSYALVLNSDKPIEAGDILQNP